MSVANIRSGYRSSGSTHGHGECARRGYRRAVLSAAVLMVPAIGASSAFAADYLYTGGGSGTVAVPISGNFSTGFTPAVSGVTTNDVLRFNGSSAYVANDDLTTLAVNGIRVDGSPSVTVNGSAANLIQLSGTNPFIDYNNSGGTVGGPTIKSNLEFTTSGFIVKSSSPNFAYDPVISGSSLAVDAGTTLTIALADTGGDSNAELNISSGLTGSGSIVLQNNVTGLNIGPAAIAALNNTADWGTLQLAGNNSAYTGSFNIAFGRVVTGVSNAFGTGTLTIGHDTASNSGGSLTLGGTNNNGQGGHTTGDTFPGTYGSLATGATGITLPNNINLGGAIAGDYHYAINNFSGVNTLSGNVTLTQSQVVIQSNTGANLLNNSGSCLVFSGNVSEGVTGALINVSGGGNLTFNGTNNWTGGINMAGGVLTFTNAASLPATGTIFLNNAAISAPNNFAGASAALTSGRINNTSSGAVLISANDATNVDFTNYPNLGLGAATGAAVTYSGVITPAGGNFRLGGGGGVLTVTPALTGANNLIVGYPGATGVLNVTGAQSYTGSTNLSGGYLAVTSGQIPAASQIIANGGGLRLLDGAGTDFSSTRTIIDQGGLYLDTNGFNLTLNSPVTAGGTGTTYGDFHKTGAGTLNVVTSLVSNSFFVNNTGSLVANVSSAVITTHGYASLGQFPGDNVSVTFDNGASFTGANDFNVADVGGAAASSLTDVAVVNIQNTTGSATATTITTSTLYVGKGSGTQPKAVGVVNQGPGTVVTFNGNDQIGAYGTGTYVQTGGIANFNGFTAVARQPGSVGFYNLSGGTVNSNSAGYFLVGEVGTGVLNISGTSVLNAQGIALAAGDGNQIATGTVNQNGGTINATTNGVVYGANAGGSSASAPATGVYNLNNGLLVAKSISQNTNLNHAISGTFNFNGGTLQASSGAAVNFIGGLTAANVLAGGAFIDNSGQNLNISQSFLHGGSAPIDGGVTFKGTGVFTLSSTGSVYTGPTVITAGTVRLAASTTSTFTLPTANIQAYYKFESASDNPGGTGGTFIDSSPNAASHTSTTLFQSVDPNSGQPLGNASIVTTSAPPSSPTTGTHTGSLALNSGAYLTTVDGNTPSNFPLGNSPYTLAAWINGSGVTSNGNTAANGYGIVGWGTYGTGLTVNAFRTGGGTNFNQLDNYWWNNDFAANVPGGGVPLVNQWHYVAATYDGTVRTLYIDGQVIGQNTPGAADAVSNLNFAVGATNNFSEIFDGNMADLLIADTAFSPGQIALAESGNLTGSLSSSTAGGALPVTTVVQISATATLDINGNKQSIGGLTGPAGGSVTLGNASAGTLTINNLAAGEFDGVISGNGNLVVGGTAALTLGGVNTYTGGTNVGTGSILTVTGAGRLPSGGNLLDNGTVSLLAGAGPTINARTLGTVTVGAGATLNVGLASNHASRTLLTVNSITVGTGGSVDLSNNDMIVNGSTATLSAISALVAKGYNLTGGANWQGSGGITSSAAAANTSHLYALGVIQNNQGGSPIYNASNLFAGATPNAGDILVKFTYFGDANLDGKIDGSDYSLIDAGYAADKSTAGSATGWFNGDFNYDGTVDGSDYALLDNTFNNQGVQLSTPTALIATATAEVAGPTAVPEPASIGLIAAGFVGIVTRRRRK